MIRLSNLIRLTLGALLMPIVEILKCQKWIKSQIVASHIKHGIKKVKLVH